MQLVLDFFHSIDWRISDTIIAIVINLLIAAVIVGPQIFLGFQRSRNK